jgi:hypothetical protein
MKEFQKEQEALKAISEANMRMEKSKSERMKNAKALGDGELDHVPTRQSSKKREWDGRVKSSIPKQAPIANPKPKKMPSRTRTNQTPTTEPRS